jgi:putative DNA primase/helicase
MDDSNENLLDTLGDSLEDRASEALNAWPDPQPLITKVNLEPYPEDVLPDKIRAAVKEVEAFVKAPLPLIIASALSAISLAAQAHVNIERTTGLSGPVNLFMLTIAPSGERKSTVDGYFMKAIREYEREQQDIGKPLRQEYEALLDSWSAIDAGIKDNIKAQVKNSEPSDDLTTKLIEHKQSKPKPPYIPELLYADATMEALRRNLATVWPSAGVIADEGGVVFGSHGMTGDAVSRTLSQFNLLWDGKPLKATRQGLAQSLEVDNPRLTIGVMIQEEALREFQNKSGTLARGNGFFARCLLSMPDSTQGSRTFSKAPDSWRAVSEFNRQIKTILNRPAPLDESGNLRPVLMKFAPDAERAWIEFADQVEAELRFNGDLHQVKDIASKAADNVARLAALFQIFEYGMGDNVTLGCLDAACAIVSWHLHESKRFFNEVALSPELSNLVRLDAWLIRHCKETSKQSIPRNYVRQAGPLRDKKALTAALEELDDLDRIRDYMVGKQTYIAINPSLMEDI